MKLDDMLTTEQLAERWGIHKVTLYNWRSQKRGPKYVKLGKHRTAPVLYRVKDIVEYENKHLVKTTC